MHEQDPKTFEIWTHQQHYVRQLRPLNQEKYVMMKDDEAMNADTHAAFMSLLGGIAWLTQTMPPIAIYVSYLQRQAKNPGAGDIKKINRLLTWIKANLSRLGVRFVATDPLKTRLAVGRTRHSRPKNSKAWPCVVAV